MTNRSILVWAIFAIACLVFAGASFAADYVGAEKCKTCHMKQYNSWKETKMANAFAALKPEEQKDEKCVSCHTTGAGKSATVLEGVQCEGCHGPGSEYKAMGTMKDLAKAKAAGLIVPDEAMCKTCHNEKSPTFKGFTFDKVKGIHEHIAK